MTLPARFFHPSHRYVARVLARAVYLGWRCTIQEAYRGKATEPHELGLTLDKDQSTTSVDFVRSPATNWVLQSVSTFEGDSYPSLKAFLDLRMQLPEGDRVPDLFAVLSSGVTVTREPDLSWKRMGMWAIVHTITPTPREEV